MAREQTAGQNYKRRGAGEKEVRKAAVLFGIPAATYHWAVDHTELFCSLHRDRIKCCSGSSLSRIFYVCTSISITQRNMGRWYRGCTYGATGRRRDSFVLVPARSFFFPAKNAFAPGRPLAARTHTHAHTHTYILFAEIPISCINPAGFEELYQRNTLRASYCSIKITIWSPRDLWYCYLP